MKYLLNDLENDKYLIFDDSRLELSIENNKSNVADKKKLFELLNISSSLESNNENLKIFPIKKGAKLSVYSHILYAEKDVLGLIKSSNVDMKKIAEIENNGGLVVSYKPGIDFELHVIFLLANESTDPQKEKNTFSRNKNAQEFINNSHNQTKKYSSGYKKSNDITETHNYKATYQQNDLDFIESTLRIPISKQHNQLLFEEIKKVSESNAQITKVILQLSTKIDYLQNELNKTKQADINQRKTDEYVQIIEALNKERAVLKKEIEQSKLIAYNELIDNLKFSRIAIDRQVDLDEIKADTILKNFIDELLNTFLKQLQNKKLVKADKRIDDIVGSIYDQSNIFLQYRTIVDNFDSKIQSLQEIKKNLMSLQTIDEAGER